MVEGGSTYLTLNGIYLFYKIHNDYPSYYNNKSDFFIFKNLAKKSWEISNMLNSSFANYSTQSSNILYAQWDTWNVDKNIWQPAEETLKLYLYSEEENDNFVGNKTEGM